MSQEEPQFIPYHAETRVGRGKALVFAPHPDDEVFGCGGAIMQHVADGDEVRVIIVTDGAFGAARDDGYAQTRQQESRAAAKVLGYGEPIFWNRPDRGLNDGKDLVKKIQSAIAEWRPSLVYAPSWWEIHPDHTAVSLAVTETLRRQPGPMLVLYEVGVPLQPNLLLDITAWVEQKKRAMACFVSQMAQQSYADHLLALHRFRTYTLPANVRWAEAYRHVAEVRERPRAPRMMRVNAEDDFTHRPCRLWPSWMSRTFKSQP